MKTKKTHWLRNSIIILVLFGIGGLVLTSVQFFGNPDPTCATATIEFSFEGAADGIAPNGSMFNLSDIASESVLSKALSKCEMEDKYSVEQLQECLVTRGVYPDNYVQKVNSYQSLLDMNASHEASITSYHATTYKVALYNDFDKSISKDQLLTLLKAIVASYKAYFAKAYANGLERDDLSTLSERDYPQQADILEAYFDNMSVYAQEMYARRPGFDLDGEGFNDISIRLKSLVTNDVARLKADMTLNAVTRSVDRLKSQYAFEISDLQNQQKSRSVRLSRLDKLIDAYDKNGIIYVSSGNITTRIENNANTTYDTLVGQRKEISDDITALGARITTYRQRLADLTGGADGIVAQSQDAEAEAPQSASDPAEANADKTIGMENSIDALVTKGNAVIDEYESMLDAFNQQEINDKTIAVTSYNYVTPKLLSGAFITAAIKTAGPICAIGLMLCLVLIIRSRKREARQKV